MPEKRLVIFDLDNTLVLNKPAAKAAYEASIQFIAKETKLEFNKLYNHWKKIVQQLQTESEPEKRGFEYSLRTLMDKQKISEKYLSPALKVFEKKLLQNLQLVPGAKELVSWLKEQDCIVAVAAGTDRTLAKKKLKSTEILSLIDMVISAADVGSMKPNLGYYQLIMDEYQVTPQQTMVISDSKQEDLEPAQKLGCLTLAVPVNNTHLSLLKVPLSEFLSYAT